MRDSIFERERKSCPNKANHTPHPTGYIAHEEWARKMMETHEQQQCPGCGFWEIWVKKGEANG